MFTIYLNKAALPTYTANRRGLLRRTKKTFESFHLTTGPLQPAPNMLVENVEIIFVPQCSQSLGFVTVQDKNPNGKLLGKKKYWGMLTANPTDQEIINIALNGGKWKNHGLNVAYTHYYKNS